MFERFESQFEGDRTTLRETRDLLRIGFDSSLLRLFQRHAGQTVGNNIYRILSVDQGLRIGEIISTCFDGYDEKIFCFGCDWMGRVFASNDHTPINGHPSVMMFHPEYGELFTLPYNVVEFHNDALVDLREDILAENFYGEWLRSGGKRPSSNECVGHKVPLFLNGDDDLSNLELTNLEVYWTVAAQLLIQIRSLPDGTAIEGIELKT
tara:strand:+ start:549 stop:1172 length:624 start_codon:yes stop_codon:yes gene_type:complete